jgi:1-acyl-sn-glycerol-3-phosphate acyltransferase
MCCSKINIFIRSLIFFIYSMIAIPIYSVLVIISVAVPLRYRHMIIRSFMRLTMWVLRVVCHLDYKVEGLENIPKNRNGIILSKHQSTWETFFLPLLFPMPAIIVKRELFWVPLFGWGLAISDPIAIDRNNKTSAMQQIISKGKKCLEAGRWVLVFPEGTRIPYGTVGHYKAGGARLAVATGYPIIPIAHNAGRFWPRRQFLKYPGTITVVIGPLIETHGRTAEELITLTQEWIESSIKLMA